MKARHDFEQNLAIIIGINRYVKEQSLKLAVPDAKRISETLSSADRTPDETYKTLLLTDEMATSSKLNQLLQDLEQGKIDFPGETILLKENQRLLFYFAGHGYASMRETSEAAENKEYLLTQDAQELPMRRLVETLKKVPCRHRLLILDCCFSESVRRALGSEPTHRTIVEEDEISFRPDYDRMWKRPAFTIITSAGFEPALDSNRPNQKNSYFATALNKALAHKIESDDTGRYKSDFNNDGVITAQELHTYLQNSEVTSYQLPKIHSVPLEKEKQGGQYLFLLPDFNPDHLKELQGIERPYKGLFTYDKRDAAIFYGRKRFTSQLLSLVCDKQQKLTTVIGASGSGKSSLVKAGLIPQLSEDYQSVWTMRPGEEPFLSLFDALIGSEDRSAKRKIVETFTQKIEKDDRRRRRFGKIARTALSEADTQEVFEIFMGISQVMDQTALLFIDQFEELVTLCQASGRSLFLQLLARMLNEIDNLQLILTVRSDFEVYFRDGESNASQKIQSISEAWEETERLYVDEMTSHELQQVIERPAALFAVDFENKKLVNKIVDQVRGMPGALPLLSFTLEKLYELAKPDQTDTRTITEAHYDKLGGVIKALTNRANQEYDSLKALEGGEQLQEMMKLLMLRMTSLQGGSRAKRRISVAELTYPNWRCRNRKATELMEIVRKRLVQARLIVAKEEYIEPVHDALVLHWNKLREWIDEEQDFDLALRDRLTNDVQSWQAHKQQRHNKLAVYANSAAHMGSYPVEWSMRNIRSLNPLTWANKLGQLAAARIGIKARKAGGYLWHNDPRLEQFRKILYVKNSWLNADETEFIRQSVVRKGLGSAGMSFLLFLGIVAISGLGISAVLEREKSLIRETEALRESAEASLKSNQQLEAVVDVLNAQKTVDTLIEPFDFEDEIPALHSSIQSTLFKLIHSTQERNRLRLDQGSIFKVAFSDVSDLLATTGENDTVKIWNSSGEELISLLTRQTAVSSVAFSKDQNSENTLVATGGVDGTIKLWTIQADNGASSPVGVDSDRYSATASNEVSSNKIIDDLAFNADGTRLAVIEDDYETGRKIKILGVEASEENMEASEGSYTLSENIDQEGELYEETSYWDVAFHPQNNQLATVAEEDIVRLWDAESGEKLAELKTQQGYLYSVDYDIDGTLLTGGSDGTVKRWQREGDSEEFKLIEEENSSQFDTTSENVYAIAAGYNNMLATIGEDEVVELWNSQGERQDTIQTTAGSLSDSRTRSVAFSPNGRQLATVGGDNTIRLWDTSGRRIKRFGGGLEENIEDVVFSPDGRLLATVGKSRKEGTEETVLRLWDISSGEVFDYVRTRLNIASLVFIPGGESDDRYGIAAIKDDGGVDLLVASSSSEDSDIAFETEEDDSISVDSNDDILPNYDKYFNISFSADFGARAILYSEEGENDLRVALEVDNENNEERKSGISLGEIESMGLSADGQRFAATAPTGTVRVWETQDLLSAEENVLPEPAIELQTGQGAVADLSFYPSDSNLLVTGGVDGTIRFWDLSKDDALSVPLLSGRSERESVKATAASAKGNRLAVLDQQGSLNLWDLTHNVFTVNPLRTVGINNQRSSFLNAAEALVLSPKGRHLAIAAESGYQLWNLEKDEPAGFVKAVGDTASQQQVGDVKGVEFAPDEQRMAVFREEGIEIWRLDNQEQWQPVLDASSLNALNSESSNEDSDILSSEAEPLSISFNQSNSNRIDLVTLTEDGTVKLWNAEGKRIGMLRTDQRNPDLVVLSPDGSRLAVGARENEDTQGTVRVWNIEDNWHYLGLELKTEQIQQYSIDQNDIESITFDRTGHHLAVVTAEISSDEGNVSREIENLKVFDVDDKSQEPINEGIQHGFVQRALFTDDERLVTLNATGQIKFWPMAHQHLQEKACQVVLNYAEQDSAISNNIESVCGGVTIPLTHSFSTGERLLIDNNVNPQKSRGIRAIAQGNFQAAISSLENSLEETPNDPEARIYLNNARIASQKYYTVAISAPIGTNSNGALEMLRGIAQAQEVHNNKDGVLPFKVLIADDRNDPKQAQAIAKQLAANPNVLGVVGPYASGVTSAAADIYDKEQLVAISPVSTSVKLSNKLGNYVFRTVPSDAAAAEHLADYMDASAALCHKKAAVFYNSKSEYSRSLKDAFGQAVLKKGGQVFKATDLSTSDFEPEEAIDPEAEVIVLFPDTAELNKAFAVIEANERNLPILAGDDVYSTAVLENVKDKSEGMVVAVPWHIGANTNTDFVQTANQLWKADVNWRTAMTYDATQALIEAVSSHQNPTRQAVAETLSSDAFNSEGATEESVSFVKGERKDSSIQLVKIVESLESIYDYAFEPESMPEASAQTNACR